MNFTKEMNEAKTMVEQHLQSFFNGGGLEDAMRYSLLAGGKRLRPILTLKFCEAAGGAMVEALDFGCGVEMLHTYSLIHDDLPCMDNDDFRRGKPTCHKVYGECVATLAGDALQAAAFRTVLSGGTAAAAAEAARLLAEAAGERGMCGGQYLDTEDETAPRTLEQLRVIHEKKTGALLRAACMMGVAAAAGNREVDGSCRKAAEDYAAALGMAFQIRDDMLDVIADENAFGKPVGSDAANGKTTYVTLLGLEECERQVRAYTADAIAALEEGKWDGDTTFLRMLAERLAERAT